MEIKINKMYYSGQLPVEVIKIRNNEVIYVIHYDDSRDAGVVDIEHAQEWWKPYVEPCNLTMDELRRIIDIEVPKCAGMALHHITEQLIHTINSKNKTKVPTK